MSAEYVRRAYGVPAKRGMHITVEGRPGVIVSFPGQYIGVRFYGEKWTSRCHPTWKVDYNPPHEFDEDVNDYSMCMCGVPAMSHWAVEGKGQGK